MFRREKHVVESEIVFGYNYFFICTRYICFLYIINSSWIKALEKFAEFWTIKRSIIDDYSYKKKILKLNKNIFF